MKSPHSSWAPHSTSIEDNAQLPGWAEDQLEKILATYLNAHDSQKSQTLTKTCNLYLQSLTQSTATTNLEMTFDQARKIFLAALMQDNTVEESQYHALETSLEEFEEAIMHQS